MEAIYSHYLGFLLTWFEIWSKSTLSTIKPLFAAPDLNFDDDINDLFLSLFGEYESGQLGVNFMI